MRYFMMVALFVVANCSQGLAANSERPIVYPKNGQTMKKQSADAGACRSWAIKQTGVDPAFLDGKLSMAQSQSVAPQQGPILRGAVRGESAGSALGTINNNMSDGPGMGVAMRGPGQGVDTVREAQMLQSEQKIQELQKQYATYNRSFSACMNGKGYSVS